MNATAPTAPGTPADATPPTGSKARRAAPMPPEERRRLLVAATLPLLLEHGQGITTRQIAEAAGVAEGTIFRAFADKDALIQAVVGAALDTAPLEARLAAIDPSLPLHERLVHAVRILQERTSTVWQLLSSVGPAGRADKAPRGFTDLPSLAALFAAERDRLQGDPVRNARRLRAMATAGGHPVLMGDDPIGPEELVSLFLDGIRRRPDPPPG